MSDTARFFAAVEKGELDTVRSLLDEDPSLVRARDDFGATALHTAAFHGHQDIVVLLHDAGADLNARDSEYGATPAGWAIHYLRERGALLALEIEDALFAISRGDAEWVKRQVKRHPALLHAVDRDGTPLATHAAQSSNADIARVFESTDPKS